MRRSGAFIWLLVLPLLAGAPAAAGEWPQFHGPNRDNKSADTGLLKTWPKGGPPRLWEASGIGEGYSCPAIAGGRVYITGSIDGDCVITALDSGGKPVWTRTNGKAWAKSYPGTRSTPTIAGGNLYHLSGIGSLVCLDTDDGEVVWATDILSRFGGRGCGFRTFSGGNADGESPGEPGGPAGHGPEGSRLPPLRLPSLPCHLHPPGLGRPDHATAGVQALRHADDDVGEAAWRLSTMPMLTFGAFPG